MSSLIISSHLYEKRPLKKPKLGPPDVYPQEKNQKEDELTAVNVKQGYSNSSVVADEYGTARNSNITSNRFGEYFSAILSKKQELNTFNDSTRKKIVLNKDNTFYVTPKTKQYVDAWFKDLSTTTKSLLNLTRKVPVFNKKEEILSTLYEFAIPMFKSIWVIKVSYASQIALNESSNKSKKRQTADPSQEWTSFLCKFLKEHYGKISESISPNVFTPIGSSQHLPPPPDTEELLKQWDYYIKVARYMYEENLIERHEFLTWLLEMFEKIKSVDDPMLNLIAPMMVQYAEQFTESESLSRRLSYYSAKKINQLVMEFNVELHSPEVDKENNSSNPGSGLVDREKANSSNSNTPTKAADPTSSSLLVNGMINANLLSTCFRDIASCTRHRNILLSLSTLLQVVTLECPTALVWLNSTSPSSAHEPSLSKHSSSAVFQGSPLDMLPCEPSNLPMPPSDHNERLRIHLRANEEKIRARSQMSEKKWFTEIFESVKSPKSVGNVVNRLLSILEYLDKHLFEKVSSSNCVDSLYNKIFPSSTLSSNDHQANTQSSDTDAPSGQSKSSSLLTEEDVITVRLLCEWAVTTKRSGEYRARVVARILERRQSELCAEKEPSQSESAVKENSSSATNDPIKMEVDENTSADKIQTGTVPLPATDTPEVDPSSAAESAENIPIFQEILFNFLDVYAPVFEDKSFGLYPANAFGSSNVASSSSENRQAFHNLVLLFSELIRNEVFSHDLYMRALISRGQFSNPPSSALVSAASSNQSSKNSNDDLLTGLVPPLTNIDSVSMTNGGMMGPSLHKSTSSSSLPMFDTGSTLNSTEPFSLNASFLNNDNLDENVDDDIDKILQQIKGGQGVMNDHTDLLADAMESDKEDEATGPHSNGNSSSNNPTLLSDFSGVAKTVSSGEPVNYANRHLLFTLHFPLPQDEFFVHECNQRHILLYGVGKAKDEARHMVKKVTKEMQKLFTRKSSMDISDCGKVKKHIIKEGFNFENAVAKFQSLSIFDQQVVTNTCAQSVLEMLNGVVNGNANHLPLIESIAFLFDLMEIALNVHGLIEFIVQIIKELVDVEAQLQQKCPALTRLYCTSIGLYIIGVLYRFHNYMIVSTDDVHVIFDGLWKLVRHLPSPSDCSSAERCIFYYIYDLYSSCSYLLKKYHESIGPVILKIKSMAPSLGENNNNSMVLTNSVSMKEYLSNPKLKVDPNLINRLNENADERYTLVFNTICCVVETSDMDQLNEMSVLCAEMTASCSQLSNDWLNAFQVLFNPKKHNEYSALLSRINIGDRSIYDNLAVFFLILVARRCFSLEVLLPQVLIPSLLVIATDSSEEAERCALLSCHLILCLFKYYNKPLAVSNSAMNSSFASSSRYSLTSPGPLGIPTTAPPSNGGKKPQFVIKYACDRYLLAGALSSLRMEAVIASLKAIFFISTQTQVDKKLLGIGEKKPEKELSFNEILKPMSNEDELNEMNLLGPISKSKIDSLDKPSLPDFAKHVIRQICLQDWIHDRCLRSLTSSELFKLISDKRLSHKDSQNLLNMICNHKQTNPGGYVTEKCDSKQIISRVFQNLDEWSIRHSRLQLQFIYEQLTSSSQSHTSSEVGTWLDTLARAVVEYFQSASQVEPILDSKKLTLFTSKSPTAKSVVANGLNFGSSANQPNSERIWLVGSLIAKLPSQLQSKILKMTAGVFDSSQWISYSASQSSSMSSKNKFQGAKNSSQNGISTNSQNPTSTLLSYQPFISLILLCLGLKEDYRDAINHVVASMHAQIYLCINEKLSDDIRVKHSVQEGLKVRLSLVGAMFEVIQCSSSLTSEWCILLLQLIIYAIVDPHISKVNFYTVLDMLTSLMHTTHAVAPEQREENKKQQQNMIKKLKKELNNERMGNGSQMAKKLLPIPKLQTEVIGCEPMGSLVDTKGNKIAGFDSIDKKQGLQVAEKQRLSPWEILEGHKNPAPLGWVWFGAFKIERKPMRTEENFVLMARHNHSIRKPTSFYLEAPPLPPEDEPAPPPPPLLTPQQTAPMQTMTFPSSNPISANNGPSIGMQSAPHLSNLPPNSSQFPSSTLLHSLQAQPSPHTMPNNFSAPHMHHMQGMPPTSSLSHALNQGPPPNVMHANNVMPSGPPPHLMGGNELAMGQPNNHHMMMGSHLNTNPMMPNMPSMAMESRDIMMDTGMPPSNAGPPMPGAQMQSAPMGGPLRPNMGAVQPPAMNPVNVNMPVVRATTPKATAKPKAPRRRRTNAKNQQNGNTTPVQGQQTPPIRMNSFDAFNQVPPNVGNQMGGGGGGGGGPQPVVGQSNSWPYQGQVGNQSGPPQANMAGGPNVGPNAPGSQTFFQQAGVPQGPVQSTPAMMPSQAQQARFGEAPHAVPNASKVRLRAMLNTRQPATNQFNAPPNQAVPANAMNAPPTMMANNSNMIPGAMYQPRSQMQMQMQQQQRPQMRPQGQMAQAGGGPIAPMNNPNMFQQQQQLNQQGNTGSMMHHMQQQQQSQQPNFANSQQGMNSFNPNAMSSMDNGGMQMGGSGSGFQGQPPPQQSMLIRPQMQMGSQQPNQNQAQFMQQRTQYNSVPMGQPGQMTHAFGQQQQQQPQQIGSGQQMMNSGQPWQQQQAQMNAPRPQMTQLQRQLSANQGPPQNQLGQGPYHQGPY